MCIQCYGPAVFAMNEPPIKHWLVYSKGSERKSDASIGNFGGNFWEGSLVGQFYLELTID